jgi:hypothetical protein
MIRKLLVWYLPQAAFFALGMAASAQAPLEINQRLLAQWRQCVERHHEISVSSGQVGAEVEDSFRACQTEEQFFLATLLKSLLVQTSKDIALADHYGQKLALKNKLSDNRFRAISRMLGQPPRSP